MLLYPIPKESSKAPAFSAIDQDGVKVSLADLIGKRVALFFYPEDAPTCTEVVCGWRDNHATLKQARYTLKGVRPDGVKSHKKFATKFKLPFTLLVDEKIVNACGVWGPTKLYGRDHIGLHRTTFLINEDGVIERSMTDLRSKVHTQQILDNVCP